MTPIFCCGFECGVNGNSGDALGHHWNFISIDGTFSTSTVRSGARSFRANAGGVAVFATVPILSASNSWIVRCYVRFATLPTGDTGIIVSTSNIGIWFQSSDSKLYTHTDAGFGSAGITVTTGVWYRVDVKMNTSANPWLIDGKIDDVDLGQATNAAAATSPGSISVGCIANTTADIFIDDVLISQTLADFPLGAGYVNHFIPTSDGTHSGITANDYERSGTGTDILNTTTDSYQLIDDVPLNSGVGTSSDYINMVAPVASSYVENVFGPASGINTPTVAPRMVTTMIGISAAGTGAYNAEWLLNDNGSTASIFTASGTLGTTSIIYKNLNLADPPSAASTWTLSGNGNFNNIRTRFGATGSVDANPDVFFNSAMIEAEFAESVTRIPKPISIGHPFIF